MIKRILISIVHFYQRWISPALPKSCRYYPTCSRYMIQALQKHGVIKGLIMGTARIFRCNPLVRGGYDPVPNHFTIFRNKRAENQYRNSMNLR